MSIIFQAMDETTFNIDNKLKWVIIDKRLKLLTEE